MMLSVLKYSVKALVNWAIKSIVELFELVCKRSLSILNVCILYAFCVKAKIKVLIV